MRTSRRSVCLAIIATLLVACGQDPGPQGTNPRLELGSSSPTPASAAAQDLDLDPEITDIGLLPASFYEKQTCDAQKSVSTAATVDLSITPFADARAAVGGVSSIFVAKVSEVREPLTIVPTGLPQSFIAATGARSAADLQWSGTPIALQVISRLAGDAPVGTPVVLEVGCLAAGAIPLSTLGTEVVVLLDASDPTEGPSSLYGGTYRVVDYLFVDEDKLLAAGTNVFSIPSRVPFLLGLSVDEAAGLFDTEG